MTTSQIVPYLAEITDEFAVIPADRLAYLNERFRNRLYDLIVGAFMDHAAQNPKFSQAALARRLRSRPDVVNRWLSSPGNWTLDTVSSLIAGICGAELEISIKGFADRPSVNDTTPHWLHEEPEEWRKTYTPSPAPSGTTMFAASPPPLSVQV